MIGRTNVPWDLGSKAVHITSQSDWSDFVANAGEYEAGELVVLDTDISAGDLYPISFAGNFDGGNHTITATLRAYGTEMGLFRELNDRQIVANLTLDVSADPGGATTAGGIAAFSAGNEDGVVLIQNCHVKGTNIAAEISGGIVGSAISTHFLYCSNLGLGTIATGNFSSVTGGIVGENVEGTVELSFSVGNASKMTMEAAAGGIAGLNKDRGAAINCWCYQSTVVDASDQGGANTGSKQVPEGTSATDFVNMYGFNQNCWALSEDLPADFNQAVVTYHF